MPGVVVPLAHLELDVGIDELIAELPAQELRLFRHAQGIEQVERKLLGAGRRLVPFGVHVDIERLAGIDVPRDAVETRSEDRRRKQIWIGGAVGQPKLEASAARYPDH